MGKKQTRYVWLVLSLLITFSALAFNKKVMPNRAEVGEKDGDGLRPYGAAGPTPRNLKEDEFYRGPPSNWDEGKVDVEVVPETKKHKPLPKKK